MIVSDISWTPNDLYAIIVFSDKFLCILSRLGEPVSLVSLIDIKPNKHNFFNFSGIGNKLFSSDFHFLHVTNVDLIYSIHC